MSIFTVVSNITDLLDSDITKCMEYTTSTPEKNIMIVGKDKYLHTVYTMKKLPVFTDDKVTEQKIFTIFSEISDPKKIYLNFLDTDYTVAHYEINIKSSRHRTYDDMEIVYAVDDIDIFVLKTSPDTSLCKLRAYGAWGFGENMEYILNGVRYIGGENYESQHFSARIVTSHYPFHYGQVDIIGYRQCTMITSKPLCAKRPT